MLYKSLHIHPTARQLLDAYLNMPKHALLLVGEFGVGLGTAAHALADELVDHSADIMHIYPDEKGTISIETVRTLYVKTRDIRTSKQVVIIDDIDAMSTDAQNAFLKLLEEPAQHTFFILTSHQPQSLLFTIRSRVQTVNLRPVSSQSSQQLLSQLGISDATVLQQMLFIATGLPAELTRLARSSDYFEKRASYVVAARKILQSKPFERMVVFSDYTDRSEALTLLAVLAKLVEFMIKRTPDTPLVQAADILETTTSRIMQNAHVKTQLLNLALHLPR